MAETITKGKIECMKEVLDKLGTYNLFNYLLPGCVFSVICENYKLLAIRQGETISNFFIYYFVGLIPESVR